MDSKYAGLVEIRKAAEKGAELTHRLLTFSRRQTPRPEPLNWTALIADDEQMVRRLIGDDIHLVANLERNRAAAGRYEFGPALVLVDRLLF